MRIGTILGAATTLMVAAGCFPFPYDDYRVERRISAHRPAARPVELDENGKPKKVKIYVPQGRTNFYVEYYSPYPAYYHPGYITFYDYPRVSPYYSGYVNPYYGQQFALGNPRGPGGTTVPYYGSYLAPGFGNRSAGGTGGSRYYPGSGVYYGPGQSRPSYGIYGHGNGRQRGGTPSRFSTYR